MYRKLLSLLLCRFLLGAMFPAAPAARGVTPETFSPNAPCTRAELAAFLFRSLFYSV